MADAIIIVPCYNESARLQHRVFTKFALTRRDVRLLMVDDGSTDSTWSQLTELAQATRGQISVQQLSQNCGKAEAVRQGLLHGLQGGLQGNPTYIGYWDADLATPLEDILRFAEVLDHHPDCQLVVGARIPLLGRHIQRNFWRQRMGRLFASIASWALAIPLFDTQCGAKLLRVTPELKTILSEPFLARWIFDVELMARLVIAHGDVESQRLIYEYSLDNWTEVAGSRLKLRDFADAPRQLAAIYWRYGRVGARHPRPTVAAAAGVAIQRAA